MIDVTSEEDDVELGGCAEDVPVAAVDALIEVCETVELAAGGEPVPACEQAINARDADIERAKQRNIIVLTRTAISPSNAVE
jgi:hypothetical protein